MHLMGQVIKWNIKIITDYYLISLGQSLKTMLQECPNVLPFRDLSCPMLHGPSLLKYDYYILWSGEIQSYLKQAAVSMVCYRNLVLSNECRAYHEQDRCKMICRMHDVPVLTTPLVGH